MNYHKNCFLVAIYEIVLIFVVMKNIFTIRQKSFEIFIHAISWLLIFIFPLFLSEHDGNINWGQYYKHIVVTTVYCILFYANYFCLIPRIWFNNQILKFIIINIILIFLLLNGIQLIQELFFAHKNPVRRPHMPPPPILLFYLFKSLPMIFVVALCMVIRISQQWHKMRDKLIETEREKTEAELTNLKNQLNPHFILNTLNNIYALINFNGAKAQEAVQELSKLLRYMLYENQTPYVSLKKELDFIYNYVSLMKIRVTKTVNISVHLNEGPTDIQISPLIFISLIENAFKHGISPTQNSYISISIQGYPDGKVCCEIMNSNFPKTISDKSGSGIGLEQVYRRLELIYPHRYEWHKGISPDGLSYISVLTIQTNDPCN